MDRTLEVAGLFLCCGLRMGIPLGLTLLLAWGLRRLDSNWRVDAEKKATQLAAGGMTMAQVQCWKTQDCPPERRRNCKAYKQADRPCWAVFGTSNGHLNERCRDCAVLGRALALAGD